MHRTFPSIRKMNSLKYILILVGACLLYACGKGIAPNASSGGKVDTNAYGRAIEAYLGQKRVEPTVIINSISQERIHKNGR